MFYCSKCYRKYETLAHFNRYVNWKLGCICEPTLMGIKRRHFKVIKNKEINKFQLVKKGSNYGKMQAWHDQNNL